MTVPGHYVAKYERLCRHCRKPFKAVSPKAEFCPAQLCQNEKHRLQLNRYRARKRKMEASA